MRRAMERQTPRRAARRNVSRRRRAARRRARLGAVLSVLQGLVIAGAVLFTGLFFVFAHDMLVQSDAFRARRIEVTGLERVTRRQVLEQAGIREGVNVLAVNLAAARKRLLAHPWIAQAELRRELPDALMIAVREHVPLARVVLGETFLMNDRGELFKEFEESDPPGLPAVRGLSPAELPVADRSAGVGLRLPLPPPTPVGPAPPRSRSLEAVLEALALGREPASAMPLAALKEIQVDPALGLTLIAFEEGKTVRLGWEDYAAKVRLLAELARFLQGQAEFNDFLRADLNDPQRVIVHPIRTAPRYAGR